MKVYIVLTLTAILMAFSTGYFALFLKGSYRPTYDDSVKIDRLKIDFQHQNEAIAKVDLSMQVVGPNKISLIESSYTFPKDAAHAEDSIFSSDRSCEQKVYDFGAFTGILQTKVEVWEDFRCNRRRLLPKGFFSTAPYIHPSGKSYALLAYRMLTKEKRRLEWIKRYFYYFHADEVDSYFNELPQLGEPFTFFYDLGPDGIKSLLKNQRFLAGTNYAFIRSFGLYDESIYDVYLLKDFKKYVQNSPYQLKDYQSGRKCFYRDGNICWEYNLKHLYSLANTSTIVFFIGSLAIIILVIIILFTRLKSARLEDERRKMALQVLSHEFRTPVASMLLQIEEMKKHYNEIGENVQDSFFRLCDDVYRLQRLTEKSKNYLNASRGKELIFLNKTDVESINKLSESVCAPFFEDHNENFILNLLKNDLQMKMDTYWFGICLKNLIENAFAHGKAPVTVTIDSDKNHLIVNVLDSGPGAEYSLQELVSPFVKGNKSEGSGLGLNIVYTVMKEIGGKITYIKKPSVFKLYFPLKES